MKKWLRNSLIAGIFLTGSLGINGQEFPDSNASIREIKKELGTDNQLNLRSLGHGYVTLKGFGEYNPNDKKLYMNMLDGNFDDLRTLEGITNGSIKLKSNGKRTLLYGNLYGEPSKKTLEEIDCIKRDYIITPKEISQCLNKKYEEALINYASEILEVPKEEIVNLEGGYVTFKDLKESLKILSDFYKEYIGPKEDLYDLMSEEDKVITEEEISITARAIEKTIEKLY
ncbi:MAG: hypothetical protein ABIE36_03370 [Candidatus Diapherotrites archaeon]